MDEESARIGRLGAAWLLSVMAGAAAGVVVLLAVIVPSAESSSDAEQASGLRVCVQTTGSPESVGDLNVKKGACKLAYTIPVGTPTAGATGPPGAIGAAGPSGAAGAQGAQGPSGAAGAKG